MYKQTDIYKQNRLVQTKQTCTNKTDLYKQTDMYKQNRHVQTKQTCTDWTKTGM